MIKSILTTDPWKTIHYVEKNSQANKLSNLLFSQLNQCTTHIKFHFSSSLTTEHSMVRIVSPETV